MLTSWKESAISLARRIGDDKARHRSFIFPPRLAICFTMCYKYGMLKMLNMRLPIEEINQLRARARREGRSITMVVRRALGFVTVEEPPAAKRAKKGEKMA